MNEICDWEVRVPRMNYVTEGSSVPNKTYEKEVRVPLTTCSSA